MSLFDKIKNILIEKDNTLDDLMKKQGVKRGGVNPDLKKINKKNKLDKEISQRRTAQDNQQQRFNRQYDAYDDGDLGNPSQSKTSPKKSSRKLSNPSTSSSANLDSQQPLSTTKKGQGSLFKDPGKDTRKRRKDKGTTRGPRTKKYGTKTPITDFDKAKANKEIFDVTGKSAVRDAKKYSKGEYPKVGGGGLKPQIKKPVKGSTPVKTNVSKVNVDKIFSGTGNVKKGGNVPDKNISPKSKGTTSVKVNVKKPINVDKIFNKPKSPIKKTIGVKQSDVSKKAKEFTAKVNKRRAQRIKNATGGKKTGSLRKGNLSFPGDRSGAYQSTKSDIETRKGFRSRSGGLKADERNPFVKRSVRKGRVDDLGGDIYDQPKYTDKDFKKSFKDVKKAGKKFIGPRQTQTQVDKRLGKVTDPFKSKTPTGSITKGTEFKPKYSGTNPLSTEYAERQVAKGLKKYKKSFKQFSRDLQDFKDRDVAGGPKKPKIVGKKPPIDNTTRVDVGMAPSDPLIKKGSASSGGGSSSSGGGPRKIKKKFKNNNQSSGGSTSGSGSGGGRKPPKGSMVPPSDGVDPDGVFKGKIKGEGGFSKKQFKKLRKDRKKQFKQFMKQMKKGSKPPVTPPAATTAKNLLGRVAGRVIGKTKLGKAVRLGGALAAAHFADNAIRGQVPVQKNKTERIGKPINPKTNKQYDSFVDIPRSVKNRTKEDRKTDNELRKYGVKSFSKDIVDKTAKGGRYNPTGQNINLKKYTQSDTYKNVLKQIQKKNKNPNLDPYGVMGNKK